MLATILTRYKIVPAAKEAVKEDVAKERIEKLIRGSTANMAVNFAEPEELWLGLVKR